MHEPKGPKKLSNKRIALPNDKRMEYGKLIVHSTKATHETRRARGKVRHVYLFVALQVCLPAAVVLRLVGGHLKKPSRAFTSDDENGRKTYSGGGAGEKCMTFSRTQDVAV